MPLLIPLAHAAVPVASHPIVLAAYKPGYALGSLLVPILLVLLMWNFRFFRYVMFFLFAVWFLGVFTLLAAMQLSDRFPPRPSSSPRPAAQQRPGR